MSTIEVIDHHDRTRVITMNREERLNATSAEMLQSLRSAVDEATRNPNLRAIVLTGAGPSAFSVGADLKEEATHASEDVSSSLPMFMPGEHHDLLPRTHLPVIAAVHGYCCGAGFELALAADIMLCADTAQLWFPQTGLGIFPGAGGAARLVKSIGKSRAMEIVLTGRRLSGVEAVQLGLAIQHFPDKGAVVSAAIDLAERIGTKSPLGVATAKQAVLRGIDLSIDDALLEDAMRLFPLHGTTDRKKATLAFLETRTPRSG